MKKCSKCKEPKEERYFQKRYISEVTGKQLYYSWCKKCASIYEVKRAKEKKAKQAARKPKYVLLKKPIAKKFLVRGLITTGNRECAITVNS